MKNYFVSTSTNRHLFDEETQWAEIFSCGNSYAGILLIWDQKLCAVAHEFGAAIKAGAIESSEYQFYLNAIYGRLSKVIELLDGSGLECRKDFLGLRDYLDQNRAIGSLEGIELLKGLPERCHTLSHLLCDELYREVVKK